MEDNTACGGHLTQRDRVAFVEALLNAPAPNARLQKAAQRIKTMQQTAKPAVEIEYENPDAVDHSLETVRIYHRNRKISFAEVEAISGLPGVEYTSRHQRSYSVELRKARLFSWEEIEPAVLELLDKPTGDQWN